ncbi:uncharacterized protein LY89DRAFT_673220 [Mollisia scopiformis]|uniref:Uncharacterized protein n=1 Tax=Mollisia scopiformis TaxID=149040 RepID=A0A194WYT4_MOLSC|nr:uncharacterized protein LY89DRAFT_673220 [Mollisia scopiformis]KUJ13123.1 hypothetical protein LY89DRAFT_673220 [Mollisia scopiformis]
MLGNILLSISALGQILGPFIADFNETHVMNPRWPPHARFHNGQTMSMGLALGLSSLYYAFRPTANVIVKQESIKTAAVFGTLYWVTGLSAILYPGSKGMDPEFGEGFPQFWMFSIFALCSLMGSYLETRQLKSQTPKVE